MVFVQLSPLMIAAVVTTPWQQPGKSAGPAVPKASPRPIHAAPGHGETVEPRTYVGHLAAVRITGTLRAVSGDSLRSTGQRPQGHTGARWGLTGAEAVLELRALRANGDWGSYWPFHLAQERKRVHESRYHDRVIPAAA